MTTDERDTMPRPRQWSHGVVRHTGVTVWWAWYGRRYPGFPVRLQVEWETFLLGLGAYCYCGWQPKEGLRGEFKIRLGPIAASISR